MLLWLGLLILLLFLDFPIMVVLIAVGLLMMWVDAPHLDALIFMQQMESAVHSYVLLAIPMFIFSADIIVKGNTADRLLDFVKTVFGHVRGGTGIVTALTCTIFGSVSGSSQATVAAIGPPMRRRALEAGYKDSHITGLIVNSAGIAILVPPSIVMIYYGMLTGTSVGELFVAGIIPGVMIFAGFSLWEYIIARKNNIPVSEKSTNRERWQAFRKALLTFGFPIIILGGIYSGMFSPTEAAAFAVLYSVILEVFIYRTVRLRDLYPIAASTGVVTCIVFILLAAGGAFSWIISYMRVPQLLISTILENDLSSIQLLLVMSGFFLISCMFVDSLVAIAILTPMFHPLTTQLGIDPVAAGILVTMQATLGTVTPPFGVNIFTACAIFKRPYLEVVKGVFPYIMIFIVINLLLIMWPEIITSYRYLIGTID